MWESIVHCDGVVAAWFVGIDGQSEEERSARVLAF